MYKLEEVDLFLSWALLFMIIHFIQCPYVKIPGFKGPNIIFGTFLIEEFPIIYVDSPLSRRWSLTAPSPMSSWVTGFSDSLPKNSVWRRINHDFIVRRPSGHHLSHVWSLISIFSKSHGPHALPDMTWLEGHFTSVEFFS